MKVGALKAANPGPEADEGRTSLLRLKAEELFDDLQRRVVCSLKEVLAGEECPIQRL